MKILKICQENSSYNNRKDINYKVVIPAVFAVLFFALLIILFIVGGYIYERQHPKLLTYAHDICRVQNISYKPYSCQSRYSSDQCYSLMWKVIYGENQTINSTIIEYSLSSLSHVFKRANEYQINSSYSCWYDTTNPLEVQWRQPEIRTAIILLICGGLSIIPMIIFGYIVTRAWKSARRRNTVDSPTINKQDNVILLKINKIRATILKK